MSLPSHAQLTIFLHDLCDAAAAETLPRFRTALEVANKLQKDFDPVTQADREAEKVIRAHIEACFPEHGIIGEEFGVVRPEARYQWVIDPIDGTRAFICGLPVWGTLVGLYDDGQPVAGVMDQPFTKERYLSAGDDSVLQVDKTEAIALKTSKQQDIGQATLMTTSPHLLNNSADQNYFRVEEQVKLFRYGCDCYAYCLLASGQVELVIESGLNIYDIAALIPIIENAGGVVSDWSGNSAAKGGQILAAANPQLHTQAMNLLTG